jgi:hypothetical protein
MMRLALLPYTSESYRLLFYLLFNYRLVMRYLQHTYLAVVNQVTVLGVIYASIGNPQSVSYEIVPKIM